jgi:dihydrofolate reductase
MRRLVSLMHVSLDGFVAGLDGSMAWINISEDVFDLVGELTSKADTALYGRVTYDMMEGFWPTAASQPNPTKHIIEHSAWYKRVDKVVVSTTLSNDGDVNRTVISEHLACGVRHLKEQDGTDILLLGSPTLTRTLIEADLIDDMWLVINPVILGQGIKMFPDLQMPKFLSFVSSKPLNPGLIAVHCRKTLTQN